ncbi:hypothetical protein QFC24_003302 [Naganishia onofrii]|uniref:Uncharacterized protein n=1 Tax=Naganishia onofrii TaxID=1851511 RepID=A0ACC2XNC1_9TREE|nr:hypothetical protein QFC24_003302 [Naganishia onofrii]
MDRTATAAYLGPANSYTHQAALALLPPGASSTRTKLVPYTSIAAAYESEETYAVLPLENTIFGVVQETLACLLSLSSEGDAEVEKERKGRWRIVQTYDKRVEHCLVVPSSCSDEQLDEIAWVASHEQALGQCAGFLKKRLPRAQLVKTPSTAQAAQALAFLSSQQQQSNGNGNGNGNGTISIPHSPYTAQPSSLAERITANPEDARIIPEELHLLRGAAICSEAAVEGLEELRVVEKGVQDVAGEFLLRRSGKN